MNPTVQHFIKLGFSESTAARLALAVEAMHSALACMDSAEQGKAVELRCFFDADSDDDLRWFEAGLRIESGRNCNNPIEWFFQDDDTSCKNS